MKKFLFLLATITFLSCSSDDETPSKPIENGVKYKAVMTLNWSNTNFPSDYPSTAHFSKLIGWTHKTNSVFFKEGTTASAGIKNMAETGGTSPLDAEINAKISNNEGAQLIIGSGLNSGTGSIEVEITVNKENPAVT